MDFLKKVSGGDKKEHGSGEAAQSSGGGSFMDKLNNAAGGGAKGEQNEDALDKGIDWVQQHVFKQGDQSNESAAEQAKDKVIADNIRKQYKSATGSDFPIKEKEKKYGF